MNHFRMSIGAVRSGPPPIEIMVILVAVHVFIETDGQSLRVSLRTF